MLKETLARIDYPLQKNKKKIVNRVYIKVLLPRYELVGGDEHVDKAHHILSKYTEKSYWNGNPQS